MTDYPPPSREAPPDSQAITAALNALRAELCAACGTNDLAAIELATLTIRQTRARLVASGPTAEQRDRMIHAIGHWLTYQPHLKKIAKHNRDGRPFRNYYTAAPGDTVMHELARRGWMTASPAEPGALVCYRLTPAGFTALGLPQPKPDPRIHP